MSEIRTFKPGHPLYFLYHTSKFGSASATTPADAPAPTAFGPRRPPQEPQSSFYHPRSSLLKFGKELSEEIVAAGKTSPNEGMGLALEGGLNYKLITPVQPGAGATTPRQNAGFPRKFVTPVQLGTGARLSDEYIEAAFRFYAAGSASAAATTSRENAGSPVQSMDDASVQPIAGASTPEESTGSTSQDDAPVQQAEAAPRSILSATASVFIMRSSVALITNEASEPESSSAPSIAIRAPSYIYEGSNGSSSAQTIPVWRDKSRGEQREREIGQGFGRGNDGASKRHSGEAGKRADNRGSYGGFDGFKSFGGMVNGITQGTPFKSSDRDPDRDWRSEVQKHESVKSLQTERIPLALSAPQAAGSSPSVSTNQSGSATQTALRPSSGIESPAAEDDRALVAPSTNSSTTPVSNGAPARGRQPRSMGTFHHAGQAQQKSLATPNGPAPGIASRRLLRRGDDIPREMMAEFTVPTAPGRTSSPEDVHTPVASQSSTK